MKEIRKGRKEEQESPSANTLINHSGKTEQVLKGPALTDVLCKSKGFRQNE